MSNTHEALKLADKCSESAELWMNEIDSRVDAATTIRTQHALIVQMAEALDAIANDMTVGDRWTNAGQYLLDAHAAATQYLKGPMT